MSWDPRLLQRHLTTRRFGREAIHLDVVDSTNRWMRQNHERFSFSGAVVVTSHQTRGRGRYERVWIDRPECSLLFTVLILRSGGNDRLALLSLLPAIALGELLVETEAGGHHRVQLKWPNDVLVNGKKISGVLGEVLGGPNEAAMLGIGINGLGTAADLPGELGERASTIEAETGLAPPLEVLLAELLNRLEPLYDDLLSGDYQRILSRWLRLGPEKGTPVERTESGTTIAGRFMGLGERGELLLVDDTGQVTKVLSGDIEYR